MAEGLNKVFLAGNLGRDPELRATQGGQSVLNFSVACTERFKSGEEWKERTEWVDVQVWGRRAEALHKLLSKGSSVVVEGSLRTESWDDKESGQKRYRTRVNADNVLLTGGRRDGGSRDAGDGDDDRPPQQSQQRAPQQPQRRSGGFA